MQPGCDLNHRGCLQRWAGGPGGGGGVTENARASPSSPLELADRLSECAAELLRRIHRSGHRFRKVGVLMSDLRAEGEVQSCFFGPSPEPVARRQKLMATLDQVNRSCGRGTVRLGSAGAASPTWAMRQEHLCRCFTTRWAELLSAC